MSISFSLERLLCYDNIVIQCHDNPDADAIASGFALYKFLSLHGKKPRLVYGGTRKISKINLVKMVDLLFIPIEHITDDMVWTPPELLVTVDCQYGSGNLSILEAEHIGIIDHHVADPKRKSTDFEYIKSDYASCSTIFFHLLHGVDYPLDDDINLSTALFYGLYMDTSELSEIRHVADRFARDELKVNDKIFLPLQNSNLSMSEFSVVGQAMSNYMYYKDRRLAVIRTEPCDTNILGFIADLLLRVDEVDIGIVYSVFGDITKLSVRSCISEVRANELAYHLTSEIGGGGGHIRKAGGYLSNALLLPKLKEQSINDFLYQRFIDFYDRADYIYTEEFTIDDTFSVYQKRRLTVGYVPTAEIARVGTSLLLKTQEGDVTITSSPDLYVMIGMVGEVYPIERVVFEHTYEIKDDKYFDISLEIEPRVYNQDNDSIVFLHKYMRSCVAKCDRKVYAKLLTRETKVMHNKWNYENYMLGLRNDYIVCHEETQKDPYIVNGEIFRIQYFEVKDKKEHQDKISKIDVVNIK